MTTDADPPADAPDPADTSTSADVVVDVPTEANRAERLRRGLARLAGVDHAHLAPLERVDGEGLRLRLQYRLPAGSRPLPELLAESDPLTPGQVVTLGVPWAQALAALHARRLVVESTGPEDLSVTPDGRPVLAPRGVWEIDDADERDDVAALAGALRGLLPGSVPGGLALVLLRAGDDDPASRPSAADLAADLLAAQPPSPLGAPRPRRAGRGSPQREHDRSTARGADVIADARDRGRPPAVASRRHLRFLDAGRTPRRRRGRALVALAAVAAGLMTAAALSTGLRGTPGAAGGVAVPGASGSPVAVPGESGSPVAVPGASGSSIAVPGESGSSIAVPGATSTPEPEAPPDWSAVLRDLDRSRSRALAAGDATLLGEADLPGSPASMADRELIAAFTAAGVSPDGFGLQIISVRESGRVGTAVRLHVVDRRPAYRLLDRAGTVVATLPARGEARWEVTVVPDATGEWRVRSVASLPA